jgi:hypothetical protein
MAVLDVQVVSIRLARVTFVTRGAGPQCGTQCDRPPRAGWVTSLGRSQMRPVVCVCVIRTQPVFETIHAGLLIPAVCRLRLETPLTSADRRRPIELCVNG